MKKILVAVLLAGCVSFLTAQTQVQTESPELQTELRKLHSTLKALQRSQASQKKTFNILANRVDSLQTALHATQAQAQQTNDSLAAIEKVQAEHAARMDAFDGSLETRSILVIVALMAVALLSLVIFFTLKKAIADASTIILGQAVTAARATEAKKQETVSPLIVDRPQKSSAVTLPIEPELFSQAGVETPAPAAAPQTPAKPALHVAIAEMIAAPEAPAAPKHAAASARTPQKKTTGQCQGVTKSGARCKRKALAGTHFCTQHTK
jgi:hypothetical protein